MSAQRFLALCALCIVFCFAFGVLSDTAAYAQNDSDSTKAIDKDRATKKGVSNSLASGNPNEEEGEGAGPTKVQMGLGFGSLVVMYIVVKWL